MSGNVKELLEDGQLQVELSNAGPKLVIVDFYATWCGPCQRIAPVYQEFSSKYSRAVFLKVDVDKCPETASSQGVSAMPTFLFYRNSVKIDTLRGSDSGSLEEKIKHWYGDEDGEEEVSLVKGHMDLASFILKSDCECLNDSDDHPYTHALSNKGGYLESDCDEQIIIQLSFNQAVKIHSMKLTGPEDKGPKTIKIFINQPRTLDFDQAESMTPVQMVELTPAELTEGLVPLRFVKFQNVQTLTIFIKNNQEEGEVTQVDYIGFVGSPVLSTNMAEFKRVAGKKGESH